MHFKDGFLLAVNVFVIHKLNKKENDLSYIVLLLLFL